MPCLVCVTCDDVHPTADQPPSPSSTVAQDTNKDDPAASKKFMEITEAYEVLGDDKKRQVGWCLCRSSCWCL